MKWTKQGDKLIGRDGKVHDLFAHEYWHVAPSRTTYAPEDGLVTPLEFAILLHNAAKGEGVACGLDQLLDGIEIKTSKGGAAAEAENLLERVRQDQFPERPSRLRSYFLNYSKSVAEQRKNTFRGERVVVRCYLILSSGRYHYADMDLYERLEGRPDDRALAQKYWETFNPTNEEEWNRLEVLADSSLYFPDWKEFPVLDENILVRWQENNPPKMWR